MTETITLSLPTDPRYLCIIRKVVDGITSCMGFSELEVSRLVLAMDEACSNIIRHSCAGDPTKKIDIAFSVLSDGIEIKVRDNGSCGKGFDVSATREKDPKNPTPGGFGVNLIKSIMDSVEYSRSADNGNTLTLVKKLCKTC
jgi:anti-sigma regulatory factor (Ser/Thr protein kinase)